MKELEQKAGEEGTIFEFLNGSHSYDGVWYGEKHPDKNGLFWWRPVMLEALQLKQKEVDKYKPYYDGVIDQCAVNHLPEQDTPYNTINMLCCWEADIALDPKVSERVAELHDKIASLQERCERLEKMLMRCKRIMQWWEPDYPTEHERDTMRELWRLEQALTETKGGEV